MYTIQQNEASAAERRIVFAMVDSSALTKVDNINFVSGALFLTKNGATTVTAQGSVFQSPAPMSGLYYYQCNQGETSVAGSLSLYAPHVSCLPTWPTIQIVRAVSVSGGLIEARVTESSAGALGVVSANVVAMSAGVIGSTTIAASAISSTRIDGEVRANVTNTSAGVIGAASIAASAITSTKIDAEVRANMTNASAGVIGAATIAASAYTTTKFNDTVPVNVLKVNSVAVQGVGTSANPWRP